MRICRDCIYFNMTDVNSGNGECLSLPPVPQAFMVPQMRKEGDQQVPGFHIQQVSVERSVHKRRTACKEFIPNAVGQLGAAS